MHLSILSLQFLNGKHFKPLIQGSDSWISPNICHCGFTGVDGRCFHHIMGQAVTACRHSHGEEVSSHEWIGYWLGYFEAVPSSGSERPIDFNIPKSVWLTQCLLELVCLQHPSSGSCRKLVVIDLLPARRWCLQTPSVGWGRISPPPLNNSRTSRRSEKCEVVIESPNEWTLMQF